MAIAGAALSAFGTVFGMVGQMKEAKALDKAEKVREQQMSLEANRRRREAIRQSTIARAEAVSNATAQGAGESSALAGGAAGATSMGARNASAATQDQMAGKAVFSYNRDASQARGMQAIGQGISSLGNIVSNNAGTINRLMKQG